MRINQKPKEQFNIEVILNQEDLEILDKGGPVVSRYGDVKLFVYQSHPFNPDCAESREKSFQQKEYAVYDRKTMDIEIYISQGVLRDVRVSAFLFSEKLNNLKIIPYAGPGKDLAIRVAYQGSLKVLDIPAYAESLVNNHSE